MALKIVLKPNEKIVIGNAVITGAETGKTELLVHNDVPILRQKDILTLVDVNTPCKFIYYYVQLMYIEPNNAEHHQVEFFKHLKELQVAAPSTLPLLVNIQEQLLLGKYYNALKECKNLIEYEKELLNVQSNECLPEGPKDHG